MTVTNHYEVLGVAATAPLAVIKAAHRAQMREHHPDAATGSEAMAQALNEALRVLQDAKLRAAYDAALALGGAAAGGIRGDGPTQWPGAGPAPRSGDGPDPRSGDGPEPRPGESARAPAPTEEERRARAERVRAEAREATAQAARRERERDAGSARREASARDNARWPAQQDPANLAGSDVFVRNGIRLSAMGWHNREYLPLEIREAPPRRSTPARMSAWVLLGLTVMLSGAPAVLAARNNGGPAAALLLLLLVLAPALAGGWARARGRGRTWSAVPYVLFLGYAGGFLVPALAGGPGANAVPLAWLGTYVLTVETFRATGVRPLRARRLLEPQEIRRRTHWEPGPDPADGLPGTPAGPGELLTGQLLGALDRLPGCRRIHPLALPGNPNPWSGHGVLCGGRLALIDTLHRQGGQDLHRPGGPTGKLPGREAEAIGNRFPMALQEFSRSFPGLEVRGWSVSHGTDGARMPVDSPGSSEPGRPVSAEAMLREVGDWLAGGQPHVVDRQALSELVLGPGPGRGGAKRR